MEKQGVDGRRRNNGAGLLAMCTKKCLSILLVILMLSAAVLAAQDEPQILIRTTSGRPVAGSTWVLTLLIAHGEPGEVEVRAPNFSDAIFLDQVLKGPRLRDPVTGQTFISQPSAGGDSAEMNFLLQRWTAMEYRFALNNPGTVTFDSFTVITPYGQVKTAPFTLQILRPASAAETRRFQTAWERIPSGLTAGESAVIGLRINGWNEAGDLPGTALFIPPVPRGLILESLPVSPEEQSLGTALKLQIIPLEANPFVLERRQITHNGMVFDIPALRIPVSRAAGERAENEVQGEPQEIDEAVPPVPFPAIETLAQGNPRLYQRHMASCETVYGTARNLWERGYLANALAALRKNEREHPAGSLFALVRRKAELTLGFTATNNEKRGNPLLLGRSKSRTAVLKETAIRRVPDRAGEIIGYFREGQPALVLPGGGTPAAQRTESWLRVTANDSGGISGWVPEECVIFY